jgi:hypothetical protein
MFEEETSKILYLEHNFDTPESMTEVPENFCMWCWRGIQNISWTDRVRNEEILR